MIAHVLSIHAHLLIGQWVLSIGCVLALVAVVGFLFRRQWIGSDSALVAGAVACICFALAFSVLNALT